MKISHRLSSLMGKLAIYLILIVFGFIMLFPFLVMVFTSFKYVEDTFSFPPRLLPREQITVDAEETDDPLPLYYVDIDGQQETFALIERSVRIGYFALPENIDPENLDNAMVRELDLVSPTGGEENQEIIVVGGEEYDLYEVEVDGQMMTMALVSRTAVGRFVDPEDPTRTTLQNVRLSEPVSKLTATFDNYREVVDLHAMDRSLINTALVTLGVLLGQLTTSVLGGYAFARLQFPGRDKLFVLYLGTIMIPFVVLITPLYQIMVAVGWVDHLASLIIPWIFTAYGTFLMRQFFLSVPKEIEEAAVLDGATRFQILWRIFLPASTPALAALGTFTFLYAWNSFFWPLVVINSGNEANRVLTLALSVLGGRAADSPNLVLAGAAIAVLPPIIIYMFGQRFFVESAAASGLKG